MKNSTFILLFIALFSLESQALGPLKFGVQAGLSTASEEFANVYNRDSFRYSLVENPSPDEIETADLIIDGIEAGYHIGANIRISLSEDFSLTAGFMYNSLNEARMNLYDPITGDSVASFISSQRIIPLSGGILYNFLEVGFVEFYLRGNGQLNFIAHETKFVLNRYVDLPVASTDTYARIGYSFGGGIDFDLELIRLNIDARYNVANLLGRVEDEEQKSFFTLGLGIFF